MTSNDGLEVPFWMQDVEENPKSKKENKQVLPEIAPPVNIISTPTSITFKVPDIPSIYNHLRLEGRTENETLWNILKEPITDKDKKVKIDVEPDTLYFFQWVGVHPERGIGNSITTAIQTKPEITIPLIDITPPGATTVLYKRSKPIVKMFDPMGNEVS